MMKAQSTLAMLVKFYVAENQIFLEQLFKTIPPRCRFYGLIPLSLISLILPLI